MSKLTVLSLPLMFPVALALATLAYSMKLHANLAITLGVLVINNCNVKND